jgi:hypothetical protein
MASPKSSHQCGSGYLIFEIPVDTGYFKKLQRIVELHERTGKNPMISRGYLMFFQDILRAMIICNNAVLFDFLIIAIIYQNQAFDFLITMVINFDTQLDTWWVGVWCNF